MGTRQPESEVYSGGRCGQATSRKPREGAHPQLLLVNKTKTDRS